MTSSHEDREQELQVMVWYRREDWETLKGLFDDAHLLEPQYENWLQKAEAMVAEAQAAGDLVARVTIDPVNFPAWCKKRGRPLDADARTTFAIETIQQQQFLGNM